MPSSDPFVFMLEDNHGDAVLFEEALRERGSTVRLLVAPSVDEGIALLTRLTTEGQYPCLILVDLHLPGRDGRVFISFLSGNSRFSRLPAIMLSSSQRDLDCEECLRLGAHGFQIKPNDWTGYLNLVDSFKTYWAPSL